MSVVVCVVTGQAAAGGGRDPVDHSRTRSSAERIAGFRTRVAPDYAAALGFGSGTSVGTVTSGSESDVRGVAFSHPRT